MRHDPEVSRGELTAWGTGDAAVGVDQDGFAIHPAAGEDWPWAQGASAFFLGRRDALFQAEHVGDEDDHEGDDQGKVIESCIEHGGEELTFLSLKRDAFP